jgi:hypothetical protein
MGGVRWLPTTPTESVDGFPKCVRGHFRTLRGSHMTRLQIDDVTTLVIYTKNRVPILEILSTCISVPTHITGHLENQPRILSIFVIGPAIFLLQILFLCFLFQIFFKLLYINISTNIISTISII